MHLLARGDARRLPLPDGSVHCVVTSPPYMGLRDYGTGEWQGGDPACDHKPAVLPRTERPRNGLTGGLDYCEAKDPCYRDRCGKCGARRVDRQIGLEPTPDAFVAAMVAVFREVKRVLRDDGTCWINLGDSYSAPRWTDSVGTGKNARGKQAISSSLAADRETGLPPKNLLGIPWRVAFALQADGWWLRSDLIWAKPNPMPESVTDRPTKSHEYLFMMAKAERYFWDAEAVREPIKPTSGLNMRAPKLGAFRLTDGYQHVTSKTYDEIKGANMRSVLTIATEAFPGAHFATFPRKLVEPCIRAGTSQRGCCPACGAPWTREVEPTPEYQARRDRNRDEGRNHTNGSGYTDCLINGSRDNAWSGHGVRADLRTTGWQPACDHGHDPVPCTVLDPFAGSGTTLVVAEALGRRGIGCDLSQAYLRLARRRIGRPHARAERPARADEEFPLFATGTEA